MKPAQGQCEILQIVSSMCKTIYRYTCLLANMHPSTGYYLVLNWIIPSRWMPMNWPADKGHMEKQEMEMKWKLETETGN